MSTEITNITDEKELKKSISEGLQKFNLPDAKIAELKEEYGDLTINGVEDKDGYKSVHEALKIVRPMRTGIDKVRKALNENALVYQRAVNEEAKRLTEKITPLEDKLKAEKKKIDDEKDRIKKEEEEKKEAIIQSRINDLLALGMAFDGSFYSIGENIQIGVVDIRNMTDELYSNLLESVKGEAGKIRIAKEEQEKKEKEEKERLEQEKKELAEKQKKQEAEAEKLRKEREEMEREKADLAKQKRDARCKQLEDLGFVHKSVEKLFIFDLGIGADHIVKIEDTDLDHTDREAWTKRLSDINPNLENARKIEIEKAEEDKKAEEARLEEERLSKEKKQREEAEKAEIDRKARLNDSEKIKEYLRPIMEALQTYPPTLESKETAEELSGLVGSMKTKLAPYFTNETK